ncbi:MAG: autotransporter-associated beta strand repeat-containing protein [Pirellulales bacterium]
MPPLQAAIYSVNNTADFGPGSLRQAVIDVNTNLGADTIQIDPALNGGTINLLSSLPALRENVTIDGPAVGTLTVRFVSLGDIFSGGLGITKQSAGTLIFSGVNNYTGGTTINAGVVQGNSWSLKGDIKNNGAVVFDQDVGDGVYTGNINGTGSLTKIGMWKLAMTGANSYAGGTVVNAGLLEGDTDSLQGHIFNNSAVIFDQAANGTYAGNMYGAGSLTKLGGGTLTLSGYNTYTGLTIVSLGTLQGNSYSLPSDIVNGSAVVFDQAFDGTYAGKINFRGHVTKQGFGTLTLTGVNSYTGGTTVSQGTLRGNTISLQGNISNNAAVVFDQSFDGTYWGAMSGTGSVTKLGAGTLTLSGYHTFIGTTTVAAGRLAVNGPISGAVTVQNGGMLVLAGATVPTATLDVTNGAAVLDYPIFGSNPGLEVRQRIIAARGGTDLIGTWRGAGITSSAAAADPSSMSVGYVVNAELPLGPYTTFRGQPVDATTVLIRGTRIGDATLDGVVDDNDVTVVGATFGMTSGANWGLGDFDYDGDVDDNDVTLVGALYNPSALPISAPDEAARAVAAVPEPASWLMLVWAGVGAALLGWRRRRSES